MQLPDIVRQIGKAEEKEQVYIEDYVYTYLHGLGKETGTEDLRRAVGEQRTFPIRAALFGHAFRRGERRFYLIYGLRNWKTERMRSRSERNTSENMN